MATPEEMTELFGADLVVTLDRAVAEERGLSETTPSWGATSVCPCSSSGWTRHGGVL
jgi:hypothetical protein